MELLLADARNDTQIIITVIICVTVVIVTAAIVDCLKKVGRDKKKDD